MQAQTYNRLVTLCLAAGVGSALAYESIGDYEWVAIGFATIAVITATVAYLKHHLIVLNAARKLGRAVVTDVVPAESAERLFIQYMSTFSRAALTSRPEYRYALLNRYQASSKKPVVKVASEILEMSSNAWEPISELNIELDEEARFHRIFSGHKFKHVPAKRSVSESLDWRNQFRGGELGKGGLIAQMLVLRNADDVFHIVSVDPVRHLPAARV